MPTLSAEQAPTRHRRASTMSMGRLKTLAQLSRTPLPSVVTTHHDNVAYGAFTPTSSAFPSLLSLSETAPPSPVDSIRSYHRRRVLSSCDAYPDRSITPVSPSSSISGSRPPSIPSISRTSSLISDSASSYHIAPPSHAVNPAPKTEMNPILADLERKSKFCTSSMSCASCRRGGSQFPRCPRCALAFCSRDCRLDTGRHSCALKKAR